MKFTILQQDLLPPLQTVVRSTGIRSTLPILENILFTTEGSKVRLSATNLEIGVIKFVPAQIQEPGEIVVPAKTILEVVTSLKEPKIDISTNQNSLIVSAGKFQATISAGSSSEFPVIPVGGGEGISLPKNMLNSCAQILYAAATDEGRPTLTGVLTQSSAGKLDFVATDGFRLAHRQIQLALSPLTSFDKSQDKSFDKSQDKPLGINSVKGFRSLIPKKTLEEVLKIISEEGVDEVVIKDISSQNQIIFHIGETIISSRLIEGQFPSWEKIIPTQIQTTAIINKEQMLVAVKLAAVFAKNEANIIVLKLEKDKMVLSSSAKELGSQQNEIEADVSGDGLTIAFNARFLIDAISNAPSSKITLNFSGSLSACLIRPVGVEGLEYILMPVKLS